jgi:hypothetical protein
MTREHSIIVHVTQPRKVAYLSTATQSHKKARRARNIKVTHQISVCSLIIQLLDTKLRRRCRRLFFPSCPTYHNNIEYQQNPVALGAS